LLAEHGLKLAALAHDESESLFYMVYHLYDFVKSENSGR